MNLDSVFTATVGDSESERKPYQAPALTLFGSVGRLTATGSRSGQEDTIENGTCINIPILGYVVNMTFNMC